MPPHWAKRSSGPTEPSFRGSRPTAARAAKWERSSRPANAKGVLPFFAIFNRIHTVPPINTAAEDVRKGIRLIGEELGEAWASVTSS